MDSKTISTSSPNKYHANINVFSCSPKPENFPVQLHRHNSFEISYVKSGSGVYETSTAKYSIKPNDIFLFRNNELHWISEVSPDEPMLVLNIQFDPRFILKSGAISLGFDYLRLFIDKNRHFCHRLDRSNALTRKLWTQLQYIENEFEQKQPEYMPMIKIALMKFFVILKRHFNYGIPGESFSPPKNSFDAIENSISYIHEHLTEDLKLDELARIANMSPAYYSTLFKKINSVSPWDYIIDRRIDLAVSQLLNGSDVTILELALSCGFKTTANFNRSFKKLTGYTPSEYKALISKTPD